MPVIINYKICDQASACSGISVCPVGAFTYNEKTKKVEVDNEKCIGCGACARSCPIGAIGFARTPEEFEELKQAIEEDPRTPEDLFVDRYGADIINQDVVIDFKDLEKTIAKEDCLIEILNLDEARCLLKSIPYHEILQNCPFKKYYRCCVTGEENISKYKVKEFPSLLVCRYGKVAKVVSGYFEEQDKEKLFKLLK